MANTPKQAFLGYVYNAGGERVVKQYLPYATNQCGECPPGTGIDDLEVYERNSNNPETYRARKTIRLRGVFRGSGDPAVHTRRIFKVLLKSKPGVEVRNAKGNQYVPTKSGVLAVYHYDRKTGQLRWSEQHLYGSSRLGMYQPEKIVTSVSTDSKQREVGYWGKQIFELSNHLGNVLATITDKKLQVSTNNSSTSYFEAEVQTVQDYYAFGMQMPGRKSSGGYRYGFNGQEKSNEIFEGSTAALFWEYDSRIGRRWNLDPKYNASESRYLVNGDNPIYYTDPNGDFKTKFGAWLYKVGHGGKIGRHEKTGQWYVGKKIEAGKGAKGRGKLEDGSVELDEVVVAADKRIYGWNGQNRPIDFNGKNPMTPWDVGVEWLSGTGNREHHFKDGDPFTELYKKHEHVQQTKQMVVNQLNSSGGTNTTDGKNPYNLSGIEGVGKYIKDYSTLATGGLTGNIAFTYLGSHSLKFTITSVDIANKTAEVHFTAHNTSTIQSALRPPVIGYKPWWQNTVGKRLNNQFKTGPMSKTEQSIEWTETIKW